MAKAPKIRKIGFGTAARWSGRFQGPWLEAKAAAAMHRVHSGEGITLEDAMLIIEHNWAHTRAAARRTYWMSRYEFVQEAFYAGYAIGPVAAPGGKIDFEAYETPETAAAPQGDMVAPLDEALADVKAKKAALEAALNDLEAAEAAAKANAEAEAPAYQPGDVANGHVLAVVDGAYQWLPLAG